MKASKFAASLVALAVVASSFSFSAPAQAAPAYVPTAKVRASLENVKVQASAWYAFRVSSVGKSQADAQATLIADKLGVMQLKARGNRVKTYLYSNLRQHLQALVAGTSSKPAASTGTSVPPKAVTETKQLTKDETKTVVSVVNSDKGQLEAAKELQSAGLSDGDSMLMAFTTPRYGDDIFFCAPFTGDVYPVESKYSGGNNPSQFAAMDDYNAWELRVIYKGDVFYQPDEITKKNVDRVRVCANRLMNVTQDQIKTLFDKLNLTYTVIRKPFYESGVAHKDVDAWVKGLNIGKAK